MTPYYDEDGITLYHGRAEEVLPTLAAESVSCCVTSPPYNAGIEYDLHDDEMPWPDYLAMIDATFVGIHRTLIEGGRAWINTTPVVPTTVQPAGWHTGQTKAPRMNLLALYMGLLTEAHLDVRDIVAWVTLGRGGATAWGSWQSPAGPNLRGEWEAIIVAHRGQWARETPPEHKGWQDGEGGWTPLTTNVWKMQPQARDLGHPAPFPEELPRRAIRLSTWPVKAPCLEYALAIGRSCAGVWGGRTEVQRRSILRRRADRKRS